MQAADLTVPGLLLTYATGATAVVAFLWRHYETKLDKLREELKAEQREHDQHVLLFSKVLERKRLMSSQDSEPPSRTGTR